jgi:hypothetical protein
MKKQQNFSDLAGILLLAAVLVGIFIFVSKPGKKPVVTIAKKTEIAEVPVKIETGIPRPLPPKETPKPPPEIIRPVVPVEAPKPAAVVVKPKAAPAVVKPKPVAEIEKPKPKPEPPKPILAALPKPKVVEKPAEKKVETEAVQQKPKFSLFQLFKPKPKKVAPAAPPKPAAPTVAKPPIELPAKEKGKIAIVIDDFGYNKNNVAIFDRIKYPITAAVLPNLSYSKEMSSRLHKRGYEIILHLPMQPHGPEAQEKNTITTSLDDESIKNIVEKDLNALSYAKGVSNHMGSLATEDPRLMGVVYRELNDKHLYFLDSYVTPKTICSTLAEEMHIAFAQRDILILLGRADCCIQRD